MVTKTKVIDLAFTEIIPPQKIRGVYLLWKSGIVVYAGQSENIIQRVGVHLAKQRKLFDGYNYAVMESGDLNVAEADLIVQYQPIYNSTLPKNAKYENLKGIAEILGVDRRGLNRIMKCIKPRPTPIWKWYYVVSEFSGGK